MVWGPQEEALRGAAEAGQSVLALENKPELTRWTVEYFSAFRYLNTSRLVGYGGIAPIPLTEIKAYLDLFEVRQLDDRERWIKMIRALDGVYMEHVNERMRKEREKASKAAKSKPSRGSRGRR